MTDQDNRRDRESYKHRLGAENVNAVAKADARHGLRFPSTDKRCDKCQAVLDRRAKGRICRRCICIDPGKARWQTTCAGFGDEGCEKLVSPGRRCCHHAAMERHTHDSQSYRIECARRLHEPRIRGRYETDIEAFVRKEFQRECLEFEQEAGIGRWLVDFIVEGTYAVEVDGAYWHSKPGSLERDARKDALLVSFGYQVIRLPEKRVRKHPSCAIQALLDAGMPDTLLASTRKCAA